ncbi:MAG: MotA/TolQ/ExbB proton channel family protein [Deltaproteobacteria bacterium]|nr:MAG: MotA/TolQ/ExbB proton channel family protein [Deltaproteobacteria bacterium]
MHKSLWDIIHGGGVPMWIIVGCSVLAVAVGLERITAHWAFMDKARALTETVTRCLARGAFAEGRAACERSKSPLADVFLVGYERFGRSSQEELVAAVHRERIRVTTDMKRWVWILGTIGATAPFIGLFGTVLGVVSAFSGIDAAGGKTSIDVVAGPIAEALYVTAAGIIVAVEAVVIFNFLNQRMARMAAEMKLLTDEFLEVLVAHGPQAGGQTDGATTRDADGEEDDGHRDAA